MVFWSNHFCISASKGELARMWAGAFEREAIRPHVLGRFADMLKAVEQHPAMLFFLDNQQSLGPDSRAGQNRKRGLNENLAREIMELHTLGVGGGYTQDDVTSLARIITGWTFAGRQGQLGAPGTLRLQRQRAPARARSAARQDLRRPTASRRARRRSPISRAIPRPRNSSPPNSRAISSPTIRRRRWWRGCATCSRKSDGDLKAMATALVDSDEAWKAPLTKMRSPYEFLVATGRLLARIPEDPGRYLGGLNLLGQPLWSPAGPNGFPDTNAAWAAPEGMKLRLDIAAQIASRARRQHRSARSAGIRCGRCGVAGDAADHRARGIAAAGAGAVVDVAGIPEEMTMESMRLLRKPASSPSRRALLLGGASFAAWAYLPKFARAADGRDPRLIVVILRGALDGLATVAPIGDPDYAGLHGSIALTLGRPACGARCSTPSSRCIRRCRNSRGCTARSMPPSIHAVATPYRDRSHFDGQDVLESGFAGPGRVQSGWLNRALEALPRGERVMSGLAVGPTTPLVLRGAAPTVGWAPVALPQADDDTAMRLVDLYRHRDPALAHGAVARSAARQGGAGRRHEAEARQSTAAGAMRLVGARRRQTDGGRRRPAHRARSPSTAGTPTPMKAARSDGSRFCCRASTARSRNSKADLGARWRDTVVVVATEFGRTARINGTDGTDHGTGTIALLAGGAVKGGRVISDWPGLKPANLYEGRDLAPTTDLRAVIKGVLHDHLGLAERVLAETVFPDSAPVKAMNGLVG